MSVNLDRADVGSTLAEEDVGDSLYSDEVMSSALFMKLLFKSLPVISVDPRGAVVTDGNDVGCFKDDTANCWQRSMSLLTARGKG